MAKLVFKRKIYDRMLQWKQLSAGKSALLVQGARRIGKSTIVEEFAKKEYHSYILIDFNKASADVKALFDDLMDLDFLFLQLQTIYNVSLKERKSLIIFDEVQMCPKARQAIKYLVADHRYDYIETGSLISIRQNTRGITIPSEEERIDMSQWTSRNSDGRSATPPLCLCCAHSSRSDTLSALPTAQNSATFGYTCSLAACHKPSANTSRQTTLQLSTP